MSGPVSRESLTLEAIDAKKVALGIPDYLLERVAGLAPNCLNQARHRVAIVRPATLSSLALALNRLEANRDCDTTERARLIDMILRVLIALVCEIEGVDAAKIHMQDPQKRATQSEEWMRAARIRETVCGLANGALGIKQAQLATAAGVSPPAMLGRINRYVDRRDEPEFDRLMDRLESAIRGDL